MVNPDANGESVRRKKAPSTRSTGRSGQRAVETVLEAANLVVQRVDGDNDIGRDAFVDLVDGTDVTGGVLSLQIKSGRSFYRGGQWLLPGAPEDFTLWRESSVPFFGVVHEPESGALRWVDLSQAARVRDKYLAPIVAGPFGQEAVPVPEGNRLDLDVAPFILAATTALRRRTESPIGSLLARDAAIVSMGIADSFALGRHDPNAFLLLGALFHRLPLECRRAALLVLAMATRNPDIAWSRDNWIPTTVKAAVGQRCRWTAPDVETLLAMIDEDGVARGTLGQAVYYVLRLDPSVHDRLMEAVVDTSLDESRRFWAAAILLGDAGEEAHLLLSRMTRLAPDLASTNHFVEMRRAIDDHGWLSLF
jgi:hypothetical protein